MVPDSQQSGSTVQTVPSDDGTSISFERHGQGPPLVLLHGSSGTRRSWDRLRPYLAESFTLYVPDRRGRGSSGDAAAYNLQKEVADLQAIIEHIDGTPTVFGHSFGGLVALATAPTTSLDGLILYEPALLVGEHAGGDLAARMDHCLEEGRRRDAMQLFLEEAGGVPDVDRLHIWPDGINFDLAETVVRENYAVEAYDLPAQPDIAVQSLLLTGAHGPEHLRDGIFALAERLPESRLVELAEVGHIGPQTAPEQVATAVRSFHEGTS